MISNWFYYCFTLLATTILLSSCLNSDEVEYTYSSDAQMTSLKISSSEDSLRILSKVDFSIDQVSSAPLVFNKDSLPYLFDVEMVKMNITTNGASGIKFYLINPDSSYIWNTTDSVEIKKLKHIEIYAQDGKTTKRYTFQLRTHQQDPDTIFWQNVKNNYIASPTNQITVADTDQFYTYYQSGNVIRLATSALDDGTSWTDETLNGLPQNVVLASIRSIASEAGYKWYATDSNNNLYTSENGIDWNVRATTYPVEAIYGTLPSFTKDSILAVVKDGNAYKFAKTKDFTSLRTLNTIPMGFPVTDFTFTTVNNPLIYSAKYLIVTGGKDSNNIPNRKVWLLQENETQINSTSTEVKFIVAGSSLFNYDEKIYLMTTEKDKNVFYTSVNYGVYWEKASNKQSLPTGFTNRTGQSVTVDDKNNVWIFGGKTINQTELVEVWRGRINKLFTK